VGTVSLLAVEGLTAVATLAGGGFALPFIKFLQSVKMFNRLRYINTNFGRILTDFFDKMGKMVKDQSDNPDNLINYSTATRGKLSSFKVKILFTKSLGIKILLYSISYAMKLVPPYLIKDQKWVGKASLKKCKMILLIQKVHFLLFNMFVIDFTFYSLRTMVSITNPDTFWSYSSLLCSYILMIMIMFDIFHVYNTANELQFQLIPLHAGNVDSAKEVFIKQIKKEHRNKLKENKKSTENGENGMGQAHTSVKKNRIIQNPNDVSQIQPLNDNTEEPSEKEDNIEWLDTQDFNDKSPEIVKRYKYKKHLDHKNTLETLHIDKSMFDFLMAELNPKKTNTFSSLMIR
jgi:hypothetical protein